MVSPCYNHPSVPSSAACVQCGMAFCKDCLEIVAGRPVCKRCLPAMRASVEQQMASAPPPPSFAAPLGASAGYAPPAYGAPAGGPVAQSYGAAEPASAKQMLIGIGLSLLIGIAGAIAIEKISFATGYELSLLYIAVGYGIGWGLHRILGRGGSGLALIAVGIMVASLCVSHLVYAQDFLSRTSEGYLRVWPTVFNVFPMAMGHLGFMHWVLIAIGLFSCYRGVEARQ